MNPFCNRCKGACCESITLTKPDDLELLHFFLLRGVETPAGINFDVKCRCLTPDGLCDHYDERPAPCRDLTPGDDTCRAIVLRRRGPVGYASIFLK